MSKISPSPFFVFSASLLSFVSLSALSGPMPRAMADRPRGTYVHAPDAKVLAEGDTVPRILYLNRCAGGCTITPGPEDAIANTSGIVRSTSLLAEFPYGEQTWQEVVACVRDQFGLFNLNITDQDPGSVPHFEAVVAGKASDIGESGAGGVAPFSCGVIPNSINFTFAETLGGNAQTLCEVIAQETGHTIGLEHAFLCEDPMTYLSDCGPKKFKDVDAECGEFSVFPCECGNPTQNSVQHLLSVFGEGALPPTADISITGVREDPADSDGNAIADPGESLLIDILVENHGNATSEKVEFSLQSSGNLRLRAPTLEVTLGAGLSKTLQLVADVTPKACGKKFDLEVRAQLGGNSWSDSATITSGIAESTWTSSIGTDEPWSASSEVPSASQGGWAYGVPEQTIFAGRIMQPSGGKEGPGTSAWMTGLTGKWDESPLVGQSTLETSDIDLGNWHTVNGLEYRLWYLAFDRSSGGLDPSPEAHLLVELSTNDGKSWTEVDSVSGQDYRWGQREVAFAPIEISSKVRLRFTATNAMSVDERLIEIGIDQVSLLGGELRCTPPSGGCGCSAGGDSPAPVLLWIAIGLFCLALRRRPRSRPYDSPLSVSITSAKLVLSTTSESSRV